MPHVCSGVHSQSIGKASTLARAFRQGTLCRIPAAEGQQQHTFVFSLTGIPNHSTAPPGRSTACSAEQGAVTTGPRKRRRECASMHSTQHAATPQPSDEAAVQTHITGPALPAGTAAEGGHPGVGPSAPDMHAPGPGLECAEVEASDEAAHACVPSTRLRPPSCDTGPGCSNVSSGTFQRQAQQCRSEASEGAVAADGSGVVDRREWDGAMEHTASESAGVPTCRGNSNSSRSVRYGMMQAWSSVCVWPGECVNVSCECMCTRVCGVSSGRLGALFMWALEMSVRGRSRARCVT